MSLVAGISFGIVALVFYFKGRSDGYMAAAEEHIKNAEPVLDVKRTGRIILI